MSASFPSLETIENRRFLAEDPVCIENSDSQVGIHGTTCSSSDRCRTALPVLAAGAAHDVAGVAERAGRHVRPLRRAVGVFMA
jgi:hypothetical protein